MLTGGCLCGAVRFEIDGALGPITCCHCSLCRRASGSAFVAAASVDAGYFRVVKGQDALGEYESSPQNRRAFCTRCGSQLFGRHDAYPVGYGMSAESFSAAAVKSGAAGFSSSPGPPTAALFPDANRPVWA